MEKVWLRNTLPTYDLDICPNFRSFFIWISLLSSDEGTENEDTDTKVEEYKDKIGKFRCKFCNKEFSVQRYLDAHVEVKHTKSQSF